MDKTTSIYLDLLRFLAAKTVFIVHVNNRHLIGGIPVLWRLAGFGNDAVMVFFVLSGFVIAYVSDTKEKTLKEYLVSRFARLYSVVAPALVLTVVLDQVGAQLDSNLYHAYDAVWSLTDHKVWRFFANLFFVNQLWFASVNPFSNGPFWSLGYEFWYYIIFAAARYLERPLRYFVLAGVCLLVGPKILILLPVWLLGVWAYFWIKKNSVPRWLGWLMFIGSILIYVIVRNLGCQELLHQWTTDLLGPKFTWKYLHMSENFIESYIVGTLVAVHFVGIASLARGEGGILRALERPIRYLGSFTFAIYLFHFPLLLFFAAASKNVVQPVLQQIIVVFGTIIVIWLLGIGTERQKGNVKRWMLSGCNAISGTIRRQWQH